ncbi:MAG: hypothetical protein JWM04_2261 [Verrucomicrobiales bacterium]|nr:hypothetical protein [Verrucomicrobiales bacterium]
MKKFFQTKLALCIFASITFMAVTFLMIFKGLKSVKQNKQEIVAASKPEFEEAGFKNPEAEQMLEEIQKERKTLREKEAQLNELSSRLQLERSELEQSVQKVKRLQAEFDKDVVRIQADEMTNLKKLSKVYSSMEASGATLIMKELEDNSVVKILSLMKETESAPILETLAKQGAAEAKRAAAISEKLRLTLAHK